MIMHYLKFWFTWIDYRGKKKEIILSKNKQTNETIPQKVPVLSVCLKLHWPTERVWWASEDNHPHASYSQYNSKSSFSLRALMSILLVWIKGVLSHLAISRRAIVHKSIHGMALLFQSISIILLAASATLRSHLFSHLFKLCSEMVNSNISPAVALSKLISRTNSIYLKTSFQKLWNFPILNMGILLSALSIQLWTQIKVDEYMNRWDLLTCFSY